jgi:hypothetical protein
MFDIQISNPIATEIRDKDDSTLCDAIQSIFPLENEYGFVIWNHIFIPVSYKYDISIMINDIIYIVNSVKQGAGAFELHWASNTFSSIWKIEYSAQAVKIESEWTCVLGGLEGLLNENPVLEVETHHFVETWTGLLLFVKNKLEKAGYNAGNLNDFYLLENIKHGPDPAGLYQ